MLCYARATCHPTSHWTLLHVLPQPGLINLDQLSPLLADSVRTWATHTQHALGVAGCSHSTDDNAIYTCLSATADPFQDVADPTVRVAMALGMDPRCLAVYNRHPGGDTCSAVAALRFALQHPLSDLQAAAGQLPHHTQTTRSVAAKRQQKFQRGPLIRVATPPDFRMKQVGQHPSCLVCWTGPQEVTT